MAEQDEYSSKGNGYTLQCIDRMLLGVYQYTPMSGSSYIPLPDFIERKKVVINPQYSDQQCFKWAILAKHVTENYTTHEEKYNFSGLTFPTKLHQVNIFEKNNPNVTVNVYGLKKHFQPPQKFPEYEVFPLKVVDEEKTDHFDLLLITDDENSHFTYISNFSRLVRSQKTRHIASAVFCKRCFTSFEPLNINKYELNERIRFEEHKLICGTHKPILPRMATPGSMLEFNTWKKTQRHPIVIYADFEALLKKSDEKCGNNTKVIQKHEAMSYGFMVKANCDVPAELLEQFYIPTSPIIFRGDEDNKNVGEHFVKSIVEIAENIEKLLQTNIPITFTAEQQQAHNLCKTCNLCKNDFSVGNHKVADHCHLSASNTKFCTMFFHNLSNYDAHFIVTELGLDVKRISVIPNSEEKFISFSKHVSNNFSIRFIDTLRFMASSLLTLSENLLTPGFEKFRETAKHFNAKDLPFVTRKVVYPYEYTVGWNKLEQTHLPEKADFYSTLTKSHIQEEDYEHAKTVWSHFECKNLGEYSDLYLKIDVLLLADVFENFRDLCLTTYCLDPYFYYTAPGFSFDCKIYQSQIRVTHRL
ncbi:hypothetical protein AGLY_015865 [Aphis glycines]|uniref:DNA-directed DNA polymerase n=1 Tax=Aphis glycines TaxID=307491 RepID=A0A6G0T0J3_APHGL|nr:hypothetical protein AGLY_015865 [Aphis glycines]